MLETEKCCGQEIDLSNYTYIRAYHACQPENVQLYTEIGLIPYDEASALNDALQKLSGGNISRQKYGSNSTKSGKALMLISVWLFGWL